MTFFHKINSRTGWFAIVALAVFTFALGFLLRGNGGHRHESPAPSVVTTEAEHKQEWTCSMHPQIRRPGPGKCPICGMDLIPVSTGGASGGHDRSTVRLTPEAADLAEVRTAPVERKTVAKEIRLFGRVAYDETRMKTITARFPGRIDTLYAAFTGMTVKKGEPLASMYSPEIFAAQEELVQALKIARESAVSVSPVIRETGPSALEAARAKLRLLGVPSSFVSNVEAGGAPRDHITIESPLAGVVIEKDAVEGMYAETGMVLYRIADLSSVWVKFDVYEADLPWIAAGREMEFTGDAFPGERFHGRIVFVDPSLDLESRTVRVRVEALNPGGWLKPDMYVRGIMKIPGPGSGTRRSGKGAPLVIPATAPLITGKRAVVYVAVPGGEAEYEGREVTLGPRLGGYYEVISGLEEGELVVVNGAFKIDSTAQILAKPSMMNPSGGVSSSGGAHDHEMGGTLGAGQTHAAGMTGMASASVSSVRSGAPAEFVRSLAGMFDAYMAIRDALSRDRFDEAKRAATDFAKAMRKPDMTLLSGEDHIAWMKETPALAAQSGGIASAAAIDGARTSFGALSESMIRVARRFGAPGEKPVYLFHCDMAFKGKGADWLQTVKETGNPFFGSAMFSCGELKETIDRAGSGR